MLPVLALTAALAYLVPVAGARRPWAAHPVWGGAGLVAHLGALGWEAVAAQGLPLASMRWGLTALALWVALGWVFFARRPRMESLATLLLGLAVVLLGVSQLAPGAGEVSGARGAWFVAHAALILGGLGGLAVSFGLSVVFLFVRRRLKQKDLRGIARLPSLDALDRLNYQSMAVGFVALTAGMSVGGMWAATHPVESLGPDVTVLGTLLIWLWYAAGLHMRLVSGWRGRLAALFGVGGFAGMSLLIAVAGLVLRGWH
jgi:ABC-type uncharacterized transport system permease subunit